MWQPSQIFPVYTLFCGTIYKIFAKSLRKFIGQPNMAYDFSEVAIRITVNIT